VGGVMMSRTQWDHVVEICRPTCFPILDVVNLTGVKSNSASVESARVMGGFEGSTLRGGRESLASADVQRHAGPVQHERDDVRVTGDPANRLDGQIRTERCAMCRRRREPVGECLEIDMNDHIGSA
jgi:hypothetical protein